MSGIRDVAYVLAGMGHQMRTARKAVEIAAEWRADRVSTPELELFSERLTAITGPCAHPGAVPVEALLTGETVACLCPDCDRQLPAGWAGAIPSEER